MASFVAHRRAALRGEEAGWTLVEVLVAVSILGISVVVLIAGMATAVRASDDHRKQANAETVLVKVAESIKGQDYVSCDSPTSPPSGGPYSLPSPLPLPTGTAVPTIDTVQVWNGSSFSATKWWTTTGYNTAGCPGEDYDLQLVTISVKSLDGRAAESTTIVKRSVQ